MKQRVGIEREKTTANCHSLVACLLRLTFQPTGQPSKRQKPYKQREEKRDNGKHESCTFYIAGICIIQICLGLTSIYIHWSAPAVQLGRCPFHQAQNERPSKRFTFCALFFPHRDRDLFLFSANSSFKKRKRKNYKRKARWPSDRSFIPGVTYPPPFRCVHLSSSYTYIIASLSPICILSSLMFLILSLCFSSNKSAYRSVFALAYIVPSL